MKTFLKAALVPLFLLPLLLLGEAAFGADRKSADPSAKPVYLEPAFTSETAHNIKLGVVSGVAGWTKFSYNPALTAASGEETIWVASGNFTPQSAADTYVITYNSSTDGEGTTGALTLAISYVDATTNKQAVALHTLGSDGSDTASFSGFGINRIAVASSGSNGGVANTITVATTTGSNPVGQVNSGVNVTQTGVFTVGGSESAIIDYIWVNVGKGSGGGNPKVVIRGYAYNRTPAATTFEIFRAIVNTATEQTFQFMDPVGFALSPSDVLYFVADTDTNNATVSLRFGLRVYDRDVWIP